MWVVWEGACAGFEAAIRSKQCDPGLDYELFWEAGPEEVLQHDAVSDAGAQEEEPPVSSVLDKW